MWRWWCSRPARCSRGRRSCSGGLGASLGFPVTVSAAGEGKGEREASARVAAVSTAGYAAFLVGPPSLGFLADHVGLRAAMIVVLVLLGGAALITGALRRRPASPVAEVPSAHSDLV
ncbi:hypothetical protein GA0115243_1043128 [Streptomyces sp. ScaeMP-e83]|nr:hypothetical protein GA0115243_1043128 [Streptomyces sp. ScaeMP-e83]